jgi:hypothetical protein
MAELNLVALTDIRQLAARGETDLETAASAYSLAELRDALARSRAPLQTIAEGWSQAQLLFRPPDAAQASTDEDHWSATEALTHVIATQNWFLLHMNRLIGRREQFDLMVRGQGDQARQDVPQDELARELAAATQRLLGFIDAIPADADLEARRNSTFYGDLALRGWVLLAIAHDLDHGAQIERLRTMPGFLV